MLCFSFRSGAQAKMKPKPAGAMRAAAEAEAAELREMREQLEKVQQNEASKAQSEVAELKAQLARAEKEKAEVAHARQLCGLEIKQELYATDGSFQKWVLELGAKRRNILCNRAGLGCEGKAKLIEAARLHKHKRSQKRHAIKLRGACQGGRASIPQPTNSQLVSAYSSIMPQMTTTYLVASASASAAPYTIVAAHPVTNYAATSGYPVTTVTAYATPSFGASGGFTEPVGATSAAVSFPVTSALPVGSGNAATSKYATIPAVDRDTAVARIQAMSTHVAAQPIVTTAIPVVTTPVAFVGGGTAKTAYATHVTPVIVAPTLPIPTMYAAVNQARSRAPCPLPASKRFLFNRREAVWGGY